MAKEKTIFHVCPGCGRVKYKDGFKSATYQLSTFLKAVLDKGIKTIELVSEYCEKCKVKT